MLLSEKLGLHGSVNSVISFQIHDVKLFVSVKALLHSYQEHAVHQEMLVAFALYKLVKNNPKRCWENVVTCTLITLLKF